MLGSYTLVESAPTCLSNASSVLDAGGHELMRMVPFTLSLPMSVILLVLTHKPGTIMFFELALTGIT